MKIANIIMLLSFSFVITCCKKEKQEFTDSPIIEAYIETGKVLTVKVERQIPFSADVNFSNDDINNLQLTINYNHTSYALTPIGNGQYVDSNIVIADGATFDLSFNFNKKNVSAYTSIPLKPQNVVQSATTYTITKVVAGSGFPTGGFTMPDPINITWTNADNSYYLVIVENIETTLDPIRDFGTNAPPGNRFKKTPTTASGIEIRAQEFQYYGTHRIIIYHVLPDYATLYDATNSSSQNLTNPSTSIVNGYGIFTGLNSDTVYVEVTEP